MGMGTGAMLFKTLLADPVFSLFVGVFGVILLFPLMIGIAMIVALSCDRPRAIVRRFPVDNHPLHTVLLFNTRCRLGGFLKHTSLHSLPSRSSRSTGGRCIEQREIAPLAVEVPVMSPSLDKLGIDQLSVPERLELIGRIWDTLPTDAELPIPDWHIRELEKRLAAADADPGAAIPWETVKARLSRRS
jgi:putative addiction module component (TIGR02574 family)